MATPKPRARRRSSFSLLRSKSAISLSYQEAVSCAVHRGPLVRQGGLLRGWVEREYFLVPDSLEGSGLFAFAGQDDRNALVVVPLTRHSLVIPKVVGGNTHGFMVVGADNKTHSLFASSKRESSQWIAAMETLMTKLNKAEGEDSDEDGERLYRPSLPTIVEPAVRRARHIHDLYEVGDQLGEGGNSIVYRGKDVRTGKPYALKVIPRSQYKATKPQVDAEVMIMASLDHPNIIRLREVVYTPSSLVMSMELLQGSELFSRIVACEQYSEKDAQNVMLAVFDAVDYLHSHGIVHCDLKPENLIFDRPGDNAKLKVVDFGLSSVMQPKTRLTRFCGTLQYTAPEIVKKEPYDAAVDMWSCGVILYVLLCGYPPFYAANDDLLSERIIAGDLVFHPAFWSSVSTEAKDLVGRLLEKHPRKRLNSKQALAHPWFQHKGKKATMREENLADALIQLKRWKAARKFRGIVNAVIAVNLLLELEKH